MEDIDWLFYASWWINVLSVVLIFIIFRLRNVSWRDQ